MKSHSSIQTIPITEQSNPISENIDLCKPEQISIILSECETQIFGGYQNYNGVYQSFIISECVELIKQIRSAIQEKNKTNIILIGAGTSGRLCRLMAQILQPVMGKEIKIIPIIAGGITALVRAEPNTEDKFQQGVEDYLKYTNNVDRSNCYTIGVSCGLSANYVVGALKTANKYAPSQSAIIGFNPINLATIDLNDDIHVLNPIIGPEPIVGSVRMKGGSTTMILIYAILSSIAHKSNDSKNNFLNYLQQCQESLTLISRHSEDIASLIQIGYQTLQSNGQIYLVGDDMYGTLCIYDAAECPPTFGAELNQVNGFTEQGIENLVYYMGEQKAKMAKNIDSRIFIEEQYPKLSKNDLVITFSNNQPKLLPQNTSAHIYSVVISNQQKQIKHRPNRIVIQNNWPDKFNQILFIRSILGQLSTGSFILNGKVYQNKMIDLRITNKKLYLRAIRIIRDITKKNHSNIESKLLQTIYKGLPPQEYTLEQVIEISASSKNIVPLTILGLVYPNATIEELQTILNNQPIIRKCIASEITKIQS